MLRRLLSLMAVLSLLLLLATFVLWWRSWHHEPSQDDHLTWVNATGVRETLSSDAGRIELLLPPTGNVNAVTRLAGIYALLQEVGYQSPVRRRNTTGPEFVRPGARSTAPLPTARQLADALLNEQTMWYVQSADQNLHPSATGRRAMPHFPVDAPAFLLSEHEVTAYVYNTSFSRNPPTIPPSFSAADVTAALLPALEDPQRFAIAHLLLARWHGRSTQSIPASGDDEHLVANDDGLRVEFPPIAESQRATTSLFDHPARYDAAQLPAIRHQWHRRLGVAAFSIAWWQVAAATAALPLLWLVVKLGERVRRRHRLRVGWCVACGYDLRGSSGRCPECGVAVVAAG